MKMTMGSTWKAKISRRAALHAQRSEQKAAALLGIFEHRVDAPADPLEHLAEICLEHQQRERDCSHRSLPTNPRLDQPRRFVGALEMTQVAFALLVLKTDFGKVFQWIGRGVNAMLEYAEQGSGFLFGPLG